MMYKCPHCNSVLPAHTATCPSMAQDVRLVLREECQKRITELEIESANWHQEYMESLNVRDNLEDEVTRLREVQLRLTPALQSATAQLEDFDYMKRRVSTLLEEMEISHARILDDKQKEIDVLNDLVHALQDSLKQGMQAAIRKLK